MSFYLIKQISLSISTFNNTRNPVNLVNPVKIILACSKNSDIKKKIKKLVV